MSEHEGLIVRARESYAYEGIDINFAMCEQGVRSVLASIEWVTVSPGEARPASQILTVSHEAGQRLLDDLYRSGLRPSDTKAHDQTVATQAEDITFLRHLVDRVISLTMPSSTKQE